MLKFLFKMVGLPARYDLTLQSNFRRTIYVNKNYRAIIQWDDNGYVIVDFDLDENWEDLLLRNFDLYSGPVWHDMIMNLNGWDVLYLLENKGCNREDFFELAWINDSEEEKEEPAKEECWVCGGTIAKVNSEGVCPYCYDKVVKK